MTDRAVAARKQPAELVFTEEHAVEFPPISADSLLGGDVHNIALFLDCDGTLLDIAATPGEVRVPTGLVELLKRISDGLGGALALLTGRQLAEIDMLLTPIEFIGAGVHGAELRMLPGGAVTRITNSLPAALIDDVMHHVQKLPGIIAEPKGPGIAVHYRLAPHLAPSLEAELRALVARHADDLVLCPGRQLFEIIPAGHSKGTALETMLKLPDFAHRKPIMIGDDVGDIPALEAAFRLGGAGLRVAGEQFRKGAEFAGPAEVISWLQRLELLLRK